VLSPAVLCSAALCLYFACALPCYALPLLCVAVPCSAVLCSAVLCLCFALLCFACCALHELCPAVFGLVFASVRCYNEAKKASLHASKHLGSDERLSKAFPYDFGCKDIRPPLIFYTLQGVCWHV